MWNFVDEKNNWLQLILALLMSWTLAGCMITVQLLDEGSESAPSLEPSLPTPSRLKATQVVGQPDFNTNLQALHGFGIGDPTYLSQVVIGNKLVVADSQGHRILIYNQIPSSNGAPADRVIGQVAPSSLIVASTSAYTLNEPRGLATDGTKLVVADTKNHRVLIYNSLPTDNFAKADVVIGQTNFTTNTSASPPTASTLYHPSAVAIHDGKLYICDTSNHRILVFNTIPTTNGASASFVLGQTSFTTKIANSAGSPDANLNAPEGISASDNIIYVSDTGNHRVLIWLNPITANAQAANHVLGQPNFNGTSPNAGGGSTPSSSSARSPRHSFIQNNSLFLADPGNNRVLIWSPLPITSNIAANYVIGQTAMTSAAANQGSTPTSRTLNLPRSLFATSTHLFIGDDSNFRSMMYTLPITAHNVAANHTVGQPDFTSNLSANTGTILNGNSFYWPRDSKVVGNKLFVADYLNNRVLIYNTVPLNQEQPNIVVGQASMATRSAANPPSAISLNKPNSVASDGNILVIADFNNSRVLIYDPIPTVDGAAASVVLGQATMTTRNLNFGGPSASSIGNPYHVELCGGKLIITDYYNHRVMIYNSIPSTNNAPADVILGQPNTASISSGMSPARMKNPYASLCINNGEKLAISDAFNHRVLIWNTFPSVTGQPADIVLGQINFYNNAANSDTNGIGGVVSARSLNIPRGLAMTSSGKFIVLDGGNSRILVYNKLPTENLQAADLVIGQPDFTSNTPNKNGLDNESIGKPIHLSTSGNNLWVTDDLNNRILKFEIPSQ
ncbi:NHL repeat-containing protein [Bdellovibrio bacteriovorus]|uniref:Putative haloacid dehalogenase-like hydrolase family protein n=1 Tax=Bdellovibrio bacteriovorus str. Tiberius TaxID=1069642 RepID=K7Z8M7_BDEBC|nr:NHL repeat-containing protein [Bdellovibrio bacteriovorus]AFY00804.1 putative haloacid dehalogenase-like hydrolase family protein [Bdellovibrio bacteriovorus str. Tiberius]